ncbi:MAG: archaetidylserine decarboxylase [Thiogranum sp.]|nr:archaetidylserine decarboxylase [Thiogranum sp.]
MTGRGEQQGASWSDYLKSLPLYLLPQHAISRVTYWLTRIEAPWFKNRFIAWFAQHYQVDWSEAEYQRPEDYRHFNEFFTRPLRAGVRPNEGDATTVINPVDASISQLGDIHQDAIFQAKGHSFGVVDLLGGDPERARPFQNGSFVTLYLSPREYHRVHMPLTGRLRETVYVPGRLFSVAPHTTRVVPGLFARNERLVALFDTDAGPMAVVLVGAINVAAIETVWSGLVTPPRRSTVEVQPMQSQNLSFERGQEIGRFNMGSTVILLFGPDHVDWRETLPTGQVLNMGQALGSVRNPQPGK